MGLHQAAHQGHVAIVRRLLSDGATADIDSGVGGWSPLHVAAGRGHIGVVETLLAGRADPAVCDRDGKLPLDWAERSKRNAVAVALRRRARLMQLEQRSQAQQLIVEKEGSESGEILLQLAPKVVSWDNGSEHGSDMLPPPLKKCIQESNVPRVAELLDEIAELKAKLCKANESNGHLMEKLSQAYDVQQEGSESGEVPLHLIPISRRSGSESGEVVTAITGIARESCAHESDDIGKEPARIAGIFDTASVATPRSQHISECGEVPPCVAERVHSGSIAAPPAQMPLGMSLAMLRSPFIGSDIGQVLPRLAESPGASALGSCSQLLGSESGELSIGFAQRGQAASIATLRSQLSGSEAGEVLLRAAEGLQETSAAVLRARALGSERGEVPLGSESGEVASRVSASGNHQQLTGSERGEVLPRAAGRPQVASIGVLSELLGTESGELLSRLAEESQQTSFAMTRAQFVGSEIGQVQSQAETAATPRSQHVGSESGEILTVLAEALEIAATPRSKFVGSESGEVPAHIGATPQIARAATPQSQHVGSESGEVLSPIAEREQAGSAATSSSHHKINEPVNISGARLHGSGEDSASNLSRSDDMLPQVGEALLNSSGAGSDVSAGEVIGLRPLPEAGERHAKDALPPVLG